MTLLKYFICLIGLSSVAFADKYESPGRRFQFESRTDEQQLQEGKSNYDMIVRDSEMPRYGPCWKKALEGLQEGCKHLTDDIQSRLALHFANCFLTKAGFQTYPCARGQEIKECLHMMTPNGFTAYTNFFTHTQSMCYFLQSQVWNEETEETIGRLTDSSIKVVQTLEDTNELQNSILEAQHRLTDSSMKVVQTLEDTNDLQDSILEAQHRLANSSFKVVQTLEDANKLQDSILAAQRKSLSQQELLIQSSSLLSQALDGSKEDVKDMLEEFRSSTSEQRNLIFEVFDRLSKLQNFVLGEVSGFYSLIFYPTAVLLVYLLTATSRTAAARFWLFVILGIGLAAERGIIYITVTNDTGYLPADEASKVMYWKVWLIRKATMMVCVLLLGWTAYKFQDYNVINNALLVQIQRQNQELKNYLETLGIRGAMTKMISGDVPDFQKVTSTSDSEDSASDFSYNSDESDRTYVPNKLEESCRTIFMSSDEEDSYVTSSSRPPSGALVPVAPAAVSVPSNLSNSKVKMEPKRLQSGEKTIEAKGSRPGRSRSNTPVVPHQSPYNLRSRSALSPLCLTTNSQESPETFGRMVKRMERVARQNASHIIQSVQNIKKKSYYSSDDE